MLFHLRHFFTSFLKIVHVFMYTFNANFFFLLLIAVLNQICVITFFIKIERKFYFRVTLNMLEASQIIYSILGIPKQNYFRSAKRYIK